MGTATRPLVVYVDVDDTLVRSFGSKQIPIGHVVERIRALAREDAVVLYCWSSGGADYCRGVAERLGISHLFSAFLPKPNVMLDDVRPEAWRDLWVVHPNETAGLDARSARTRLGWSG